jgi:hypothetical protein
LEARITALRKEFELEQEESAKLGAEEIASEKFVADSREAMARSRRADQSEGIASTKKQHRSLDGKNTKR